MVAVIATSDDVNRLAGVYIGLDGEGFARTDFKSAARIQVDPATGG